MSFNSIEEQLVQIAVHALLAYQAERHGLIRRIIFHKMLLVIWTGGSVSAL
jgi:hypothetical protein